MDLELSAVLTLAGAGLVAPLITGFVEVLKRTLPNLVRGNEPVIAFSGSLVLVILASVARHQETGTTTLNDAFVSFVAWLAIAKLASAAYDATATAVSAVRGDSAGG